MAASADAARPSPQILPGVPMASTAVGGEPSERAAQPVVAPIAGAQSDCDELSSLLRPLQLESPQVVSDFFWSLRKLGVAGIERVTQALEIPEKGSDDRSELEAM